MCCQAYKNSTHRGLTDGSSPAVKPKITPPANTESNLMVEKYLVYFDLITLFAASFPVSIDIGTPAGL